MAFVQSLGGLQSVADWQPTSWRSSVRMYDGFNYEYATIYRMQPNVRTCVDFLARNVAQLGLHVFKRHGETDRERLRDSGLARLLAQPLPPALKQTTYRLIEGTMGDLGIYFNAFWLKLQVADRLGLVRLPPMAVRPKGGLIVTEYEVTISGQTKNYSPDQIVHFYGYNPESSISGLAPLETLRRILAEEHEAGNYRQGLWQNAARMEGVIKRPAGAPRWSDLARQRFLAEWEDMHSGGENSGKTAVLEEGMEFERMSFSPKDAEYLNGRKLTREECARAYHIPPPLVGILDHATFSNIREQHKHLYQDTLGPWLTMLEQDINLQLGADFEDHESVYAEFNIAEKLQGDFEEQTKALQSAVGRPWLTANEARGVMNKPQLDGDADQLVTPLNVIVGGQASPRDATPETRSLPANLEHKGFNSHAPRLRERHEAQWRRVLVGHYRRQEAAIVNRVPETSAKVDIGGVWFDEERWNNELGEDLLRLNRLTAVAWAERMAEQAGSEVSEDPMLAWLIEHSRIQAEGINGQTRAALEEALRQPEPRQAVKDVFGLALSVWAVRQAVTAVTSAANFGSSEGARASGLQSKTWRVNSSNPRDSHAAMDGETVGVRETFSNGMRWPGDPAGGAEEVAGCQCSVEFN
jgi:HK97 family phage portal protein